MASQVHSVDLQNLYLVIPHRLSLFISTLEPFLPQETSVSKKYGSVNHVIARFVSTILFSGHTELPGVRCECSALAHRDRDRKTMICYNI